MTSNTKLAKLWLFSTFLSLLIYLIVFYPDRISILHTAWTSSEDLSLGYALLACTAYFSFKNFDTEQIKSNLYISTLVIPISCTLIFSDALNFNSPFQLVLILSFPILVSAILGVNSAKSIFIPWGIVVMAFPFWTTLMPILQSLTVKAVSFLASITSLTVLVEGNYFTLASGIVHVEGGCSGLKYFLTSITLALISCSLGNRIISNSLFSIIVAASFAILGNWIRVFILLLVAYFEGIDHPLMSDHDALGWIVFAAVMTPWLYVDKALDTQERNNRKNNNNQEANPKKSTEPNNRKIGTTFITVFTLLVITQLMIKPPEFQETPNNSIRLPPSLNGMKRIELSQEKWKPAYPQPESFDAASYILKGERLDVFVFSYFINGESEMASSTNEIFNSNQWLLSSDEPWRSETNNTLKIRIAHAKFGSENRVVYYWYKHGDLFANTIISSKIAQLLGSYRHLQNSQLIAIAKNCDFNCQQNNEPNQIIETFISELQSAILLDRSLPARKK